MQKEALVQAEVAFQQVQQSEGLVHLDTQAVMVMSNVAQLRAQIAAKQVELQVIRSYSTGKNPDVQLAERELAGLREQAQQMDDSNQGSGYSDLSLKNVSNPVSTISGLNETCSTSRPSLTCSGVNSRPLS
jgi:tyrosine-protein kinase Etk/Wzc